ncbi:response regulator transcription factor [Rhizobacter sp. J219]|uniref:response regulator transcription factor n=1 Tax=Rhizobacter sp. J219 TaxID=2898430 RepID=UPI0021512541|nr:response regulator transcription factor [Rhizobacter sp. J219]MCR5882384.1 response regulator transcription factor [Rhizobacter sp. J219]
MKLLLIEDQLEIQTTLERAFKRQHIHVTICGDGARALDRWQASVPDVVVLDLTLPGLDGLEVLAQARKAGLKTPVLVLTARGTIGDRILGLDTGADDYLPKPFDLDELEARVRALARRAGTPSSSAASPAEGAPPFHGLSCDDASAAVYFRGAPLDLTPRESALLRALLARPGHAVSKERLFEVVFAGEPDVQYGAIEVIVYRLRKRLVDTGMQVVNLRGLGYLLKPVP